MSVVWELTRSDIGLRCWGDGCIAYQPLSGETHMLAQDAGHFLDLLQRGPMSESELLSELTNDSEISDLSTVLNIWLQQLSEARLIRRHPS